MSRARDLADGTFQEINIPFSGADDVNSIRIEGSNGSSERYALDIVADGANTRTDFKIGSGGGTPTTKMSILSGGGISFNGDTGASNALDDIERGTWEPTLGGSTGNPTVTYHGDTGGYYIKTGRLLYLMGTVRWSTAFSGGSGFALIRNLPFTAAARTNGDNSDGVGPARLPAWNGSSTNSPDLVKVSQSNDYLNMFTQEIGLPAQIVSINDLGSNCMICFTVMMHTD